MNSNFIRDTKLDGGYVASNMTFKTWDFKGVSKEDLEGDYFQIQSAPT